MAVKGSATVTLSQYRDTESVTRYYKLQSSSLAAPDKPTNVKPNETPAGWAKAEPACDITKTLYTCDVTVFSDKTTHVSDVSKSTSYEAAKEAWNKANNAQGTANEAKKYTDNALNNYGYQYAAKIEVAGDSNTYYPVLIYGPYGTSQDVMREIMISRGYKDKCPSDWDGHPTTHGIALVAKVKCNFGGWGGTNYDWSIHDLNEMYGHVFAGCELCANGMCFAVFLRGGGAKYYLYSDMRMDVAFPYNPTTSEAPSIWYKKELIGWSDGTADNPQYPFYSPEPRTYTQAVIDEIKSKKYIELAGDAYDKADTAQNTADKAQNTATEAAKTADNYISSDSTGIMVSENKGATKETPRNATKNNVLITEQDVQIRDGQKVLASYGETIDIGGESEQHVTIAKDKMAVNAGTESLFSVDSFKSGTEIISTWINTDKLTPTEDIYPEISDSIAFSVEDINRTIDLDGSYSYSYNYSFYNKGAKRVWFELEGGETITINKAVSGNSLHYKEFSNSGNEYYNGFELATSEKITRKDIIALRASYDIEFNPAIVDIGQYRTKDVINYMGMNLYDFKALKIGSGIASENNRRDAFTVDFLGNGYFGNTLNVEQDIRAMYVGAMQIDANKISAENISADNITMNILRGTGHSKGTKGTVTEVKWSLYGKVATVEATFKATSDIAAGTDMCTGTFTGIPTPINSARGAGAYGKNPMIFGLGNTGVYFARNCGTGSIGSGKTAKGVLVYLTDGTML